MMAAFNQTPWHVHRRQRGRPEPVGRCRTILIIDAAENYRETKCRHIHRFIENALLHGAIAEEGVRDVKAC
jgi:hypothetical protein